MPWFVARTKGRESRASLDLSRHGVRAFWPKQHRFFIDKRTKEEKFRVSALISGYLFCHLETAAERERVQSCYYLSGLLGEWTQTGFKPREIPTRYVVDLIEHGPFEVNKMRSRVAFKKGDRVKLALNSLAEIIADVEGIDKSGKVVVRADLLGGIRLVHVEPERLTATETDTDTVERHRPRAIVG